jgi:hypothetical protein
MKDKPPYNLRYFLEYFYQVKVNMLHQVPSPTSFSFCCQVLHHRIQRRTSCLLCLVAIPGMFDPSYMILKTVWFGNKSQESPRLSIQNKTTFIGNWTLNNKNSIYFGLLDHFKKIIYRSREKVTCDGQESNPGTDTNGHLKTIELNSCENTTLLHKLYTLIKGTHL